MDSLDSKMDRDVCEKIDALSHDNLLVCCKVLMKMHAEGPDSARESMSPDKPDEVTTIIGMVMMAMLMRSFNKKDEKIKKLEDEKADPLGINKLTDRSL